MIFNIDDPKCDPKIILQAFFRQHTSLIFKWESFKTWVANCVYCSPEMVFRKGTDSVWDDASRLISFYKQADLINKVGNDDDDDFSQDEQFILTMKGIAFVRNVEVIVK